MTAAGLALLGALVAVGVRTEHHRQELVLTLARADRDHVERGHLLRERDQLQAALAGFNVAALQKEAKNSGMIRSEASRSEFQLRNLEVRADPAHPPAPVWPDNAEVWDAKDWKYAGNATPKDTVESLLWAATSGDVEQLAGLLALRGRTLDGAKQLYDQLSPDEQTRYGSPELLIASAMAATTPTTYQAAAAFNANVFPNGMAMSDVRVEQADGQQRDLFFAFSKAGDGWQLNVPAQQIAILAAQLHLTPPKAR